MGAALTGAGWVVDEIEGPVARYGFDSSGRITSLVSGDGTVLVSIGPTFSPEAYGALATGANDTTAIQAAIDAASAAYNSTTGVRATVNFQGAIYGITGLLLKPNVIYNFGQAYFKKLVDGTTVPTNSMLRTVDSLVGGSTYYGNFDNIDVIGGTFDTNGFTCPAQILRFENVRDFRIRDTKVVHSVACASWAFQIGGKRILVDNVQVLGGTEVFQDGIHITHGDQIEVRGGYVVSGDDALAFGTDSSSTETWDDEALTNVTASGTRINAQHGSIKVYYGRNTGTGMPFSGTYRGKIDGLIVQGVTGYAGVLSNGGIYIQDTTPLTFTAALTAATSGTLTSNWTGTTGVYNVLFSTPAVRAVTLTNGAATATWSGAVTATASAIAGDATRIKNVQIVDFDLKVGSASSDGVNSSGVLMRYATNVTIRGTMSITDTASGSKFSVADILQCYGGDITLKVPTLPAGPGLQIKECLGMELHGCRLIGGAGSGRGSIEITGSQDVNIHHNWMTDIPSSGTGVLVQSSGSGLFANTLTVQNNVFRKASGASTTRAYSQQSSAAGFVPYLNFTDNDMRGISNTLAIDQAWNSTGITPDLFICGTNRGAVTTSTTYPVTYAASLTIPAVHGQRISFAALTGNLTLTAPSTAGMFIGFTLDMTFLQDATGGRTVTWPASFKFYSAAWVDAIVTTDANKSTSVRAVFDGTNFIVQAPNRWV